VRRDRPIAAESRIALHAALPHHIAAPAGSGGVWERRVRRELSNLATTPRTIP
jgi:hypothetical protein